MRKREFLKRTKAAVLGMLMTVASIFTGTGISGDNIIEAEAATTEVNVSDKIVEEAMKYLGYNYTSGGVGLYGGMDCSGLVYAVLKDVGFLGNSVTQSTSNYLNYFYYKNFELTYNGTAVKFVYCDTLAQYKKAINEHIAPDGSSTIGKMIVLSANKGDYRIVHVSGETYNRPTVTPTYSFAELRSAGLLVPGTIILNPLSYGSTDNPSNINPGSGTYSAAHMSIVLDSYADGNTFDGTTSTSPMAYSSFAKNKIVAEYGASGKNWLPAGKTLKYVNFAYVDANIPMTNDYVNSAYYEAKHYSSGNHDIALLRNFYNGETMLSSITWRIEATNQKLGVGITNSISGKGDFSGTFAMYYDTTSYHFQPQLTKKDSSGTSIGGATYKIYSDSDCTKEVSSATSVAGSIVDFSPVINLGTSSTGTFYVKETKAPSGCELDKSVYTIKVTGASDGTSGRGSITSISGGSKLTKMSGYSYVLSGTDDQKNYADFGLIKMDSNKKIGDAKYIVLPTGIGYDDTSLSKFIEDNTGKISSIGELRSAMSGVLKQNTLQACLITTSTSKTVYTDVKWNCGTNSSKEIYVAELTAPSGYKRDPNVYKVTVSANNKGEHSVITGITTIGKGKAGLSGVKVNYGTATDELITYEAQIGIQKTVTGKNSQYVGGAEYALIEKTSAIDNSKVANAASIASSKANVQDAATAFSAELAKCKDNAGKLYSGSIYYQTTAADGTIKYYGNNGTIDLQKESSKEYYLVEIFSPAKYVIDNAIYKMTLVGAENAVDSSIKDFASVNGIKASAVLSKTNASVVVGIDDEKSKEGQFRIQKTDENGNVIEAAGFEFGIYASYDEATNKLIGGLGSIVTDNTGYTNYRVIPFAWDSLPHDFYIKELAVPAGSIYEVSGDVYKVHLVGAENKNDSTISVTKVYDGKIQKTVHENINSQNACTFAFANEKKDYSAKFKIKKTDLTGNIIAKEGFIFDIYSGYDATTKEVTGTIVGELTTDETGYTDYFVTEWKKESKTDNSRTFYVKEKAVPDDTMKLSDVTYEVCVTDNGDGTTSMAVKNMTTGENVSTDAASSYAHANDYTYLTGLFKVQKIKEDESTANVAEIEYTLYEDEACEYEITSIITNEKGIAEYTIPSYKKVDATTKTYFIKETKLPSDTGMVLNNTLYKVTVTGAEQKENCTLNVYNCTDGKVVTVSDLMFTHKNDSTHLTVYKYESDESVVTTTPVAGAELAIYKVGSTQPVQHWVTDGSASYSFVGLAEGSYILRELNAPAGYKKADDIEFTIEAKKDVQEVTMYNEGTTQSFKKTDITTGEEVIGATLEIHKDDNGTVGDILEINGVKQQWQSDGTTHVVKKIPVGKYWLVETAAPTENGFTKAESIPFEITDSGTAGAVLMKDDHTELDISKIDFTTGQLIDGAELRLEKNDNADIWWQWTTKKNADGTFTCINITNGSAVSNAVTTSKNGKMAIEYIPAGEYTLTENAAPAGYAIAESIAVTVKAVGACTEIQTVVMKDERVCGRIQIEKANQDGEKLSAAEFEIRDMQGKLVDKLITDEKGYAISKILPIDERGADGNLHPIEYTLIETKAPEGYVKLEAPIKTVIDQGNDKTSKISVHKEVIINYAQQKLPATGGQALLYWGICGLCVLAAGIMFVIGKKKSGKQK